MHWINRLQNFTILLVKSGSVVMFSGTACINKRECVLSDMCSSCLKLVIIRKKQHLIGIFIFSYYLRNVCQLHIPQSVVEIMSTILYP